jgi:hypothetical protein
MTAGFNLKQGERFTSTGRSDEIGTLIGVSENRFGSLLNSILHLNVPVIVQQPSVRLGRRPCFFGRQHIALIDRGPSSHKAAV